LVWLIKVDDDAQKDLNKLDKPIARRITAFLREPIATLEDPREIGEALKGSRLGEFWKYRVGDYRIIAKIEDKLVTILIVRVGNRKDVYRT